MTGKDNGQKDIPDLRKKDKDKKEKRAVLSREMADRLEEVFASGPSPFLPQSDLQLLSRRLLQWDDPKQRTVVITPEAKNLLFSAKGTVKEEFIA